jgi:hypothetical protein
VQVVIVVGRCNHTGDTYGIRFEEQGAGVWVFDWAFRIRPEAARREGYDRTVIEGRFVRGEHYPGCPSCGAPGFFLCGCGRVNCWDGEHQEVTCAWCKERILLGESITSLRAEGDI